MKNIYLIRHCKAEGQSPLAQLTSDGHALAGRLAMFLSDKNIDYIISSPFVRTIQTIEPFAAQAGLTIHTDQRLQERTLASENLPDWLDRLEESFHDLDLKLDGGESSREAMYRAMAVITELKHRKEKNIAVVSHGNLISLILKHFNNRYGFMEWALMTNPDIFLLAFNHEVHNVKRIWSP